MERLPEFEENKLSKAQKKVYDKISAGPRGGVRGPFKALLMSPELGDLVQAVGGHLRYSGTLPGHLRELAILVTGRHLSAQYEFFAHASIGIKEGLDPDIVEDIRLNKLPKFNNKEMELVYTLSKSLNETHNIEEQEFEVGVRHFGYEGMVELVVLCGYYTLIGITLNAFKIEPGKDDLPFDG